MRWKIAAILVLGLSTLRTSPVAAATVEAGSNSPNTMYVHISGLSRGDSCELTYDTNTAPSVGGNADPAGNLNFDNILMSQGSHKVKITCHGRKNWQGEETVNVGPTSSAAPPAPPASAEESLSGTYTVTASTGVVTWTITPCGPGCAHVTTSGGSADARLANGQWAFVIRRPDAVRCGDGRTVPATLNYSFDAATLTGRIEPTDVGGCGDGGLTQALSITLTKTR
jgi:hypothetical protein